MYNILVGLLCILIVANTKAADKPINESQFKGELARRGYGAEMSIVDAVAEFNTRAMASEIGKAERPLTESEVLAALMIAEPRGRLRTKGEDKSWIGFAKKKVLPRGAYLMFQTSEIFENPINAGSLEVKMWSISIVFGLDKNPPKSGTWDPNVRLVELPVRLQVLDLGRY